MNQPFIPFNWPYVTGREIPYITECLLTAKLAGDGTYTRRCQEILESRTKARKALLTHSCTGALEIAALLLDLQPGDEVILPSFTFVSTANAFVLRGAVPVFVDIRADTLNVDETLIEAAITPRTRAIVPVHYAGVGCEMDAILEIAQRHNLKVIEDAAQGIHSKYKDRALGSIGDLGTLSFHETKNIIAGEGGALLVNNPALMLRAEIIREKGTDRSRFFRGEIDKYSWQEVGSSFLPSEMIAAFLVAQLEDAQEIMRQRILRWERYDQLIKPLEASGLLRCPIIPPDCENNAHMYYVLVGEEFDRQALLREFKRNQIEAVFHYVPLHSSPAGRRYTRSHGDLTNTVSLSERIIRLPMSPILTIEQQERVVTILRRIGEFRKAV